MVAHVGLTAQKRKRGGHPQGPALLLITGAEMKPRWDV